MENTVTLLWSGGWDGTFRLLQLCQYNITIQPVYIVDTGRLSTSNEITAMNTIITMCRSRFVAHILDINFFDKEEILDRRADENITNAFKKLRMKYNIGTQYEWFALLCNDLNLAMESAVVHQYHGKVEDAINAEGKLTLLDDIILGKRCVVDLKNSSNDLALVFGKLILPVIELTKKDEERIARENGWIDIMKHSWFCHSPINGEPCGLCGPCDDAMNTGMEWRMPPLAIKRYNHRKIYSIMYKIKRKLNKII